MSCTYLAHHELESVNYIIILTAGSNTSFCLLRFFTFILLLFLVHSMGIALFRFIGGLARNEVIASTGGSFFFLILLLVGGFLLAKNRIPDWWIWAYW